MARSRGTAPDALFEQIGPPRTHELLVDLWPELDLPDPVRVAWQPLIDAARNGPNEEPLEVSFDDIQKSKREELRERIAARRAEAARRLAERD